MRETVKLKMSVTKEKLMLADQIIAVCRRKDGSIKWMVDTSKRSFFRRLLDRVLRFYNSMVKTGMAQVAGLILTDQEAALDKFDFIGIGTGTTAPTADDTDLQTSVKRKAGTGTRVTTSFTNDTAQIVATFSSADGLSGSHSIAEYGVFTAVSAGVMLFRKVEPAKSVDWDAGDTLEVTAKCQMKQGT